MFAFKKNILDKSPHEQAIDMLPCSECGAEQGIVCDPVSALDYQDVAHYNHKKNVLFCHNSRLKNWRRLKKIESV